MDSYEIRNTCAKGQIRYRLYRRFGERVVLQGVVIASPNGLLSGDKRIRLARAGADPVRRSARALYTIWQASPHRQATDSWRCSGNASGSHGCLRAEKTSIMEGVGGGKFSPDRSVTRQEAATFLTRQRKLSGEDIAADSSIVKQFTDGGTIADWAAAGVAYCAKTGLVQGKPGKVFAPKSTITRAEMATIMQRIAA